MEIERVKVEYSVMLPNSIRHPIHVNQVRPVHCNTAQQIGVARTKIPSIRVRHLAIEPLPTNCLILARFLSSHPRKLK